MRRNRLVLCGALLALLMGMAGALRAEVLCEEPSDDGRECGYLLIAGITEEPDPINMAGTPIGVNPSDVAPDSGSPQVASGYGVTVAVWTQASGGNGDIVFSEWGPDGWQEHALTYRGSDERDPRVDIAEDGAIYVTWWETEAPQRVRVVRRDPVSLLWEQSENFAGMYGGRPSILVLDDEVLVAFERRARSGGQQIVVRRAWHKSSIGDFSEDVVATTQREAPLEAELYVKGDRPFMDWIHRAGFFGYSEYQDGRWGASLDRRPLTQRHWAQFPPSFRLAVTPSR